MRRILILALIFTYFQNGMAQESCGTSEYEKYLDEMYPGYSDALQKTRTHSISQSKKLAKKSNDTIYRIPVVFHVLWNKDSENIDDSLIFSQMLVLNEAFKHTHSDTSKVRDIFKLLAGDTKIEFYLATKDPDGNPTDGIDRVKTSVTDFGATNNLFAESVKSTALNGVDAWDTKKYLNIWVCNFTFRGTQTISAYAFPPTNAQFWAANNFTSDDLQGVVANSEFVGIGNPEDKSNGSLREKTLIHEIGHYLGLRHIWADKNNTCIGQDDGFEDTPFAASATRSCFQGKNSCRIGTDDLPDMIENYMDYTPYPCTLMFTEQQRNLMRFNLLSLRKELSETVVIFPPRTEPLFDKITMYPNPAEDVLKIQFKENGLYHIILTDVIGQVVEESDVQIEDNFDHQMILSGKYTGLYHIRILRNNQILLKDLILIK